MRTVLLALTIYVGLIESSWAYLNPGTSSLILQGFAASFAVVMGALTLGWQQVKNFFLKFLKKPSDQEAESLSPDEQGR